MPLTQITAALRNYFNISDDLDDLTQARRSIIEGVSFRGSNIIILIIAIFIASLGLNTNSPAVIIGAMLISPLMGPIIGIGLGVGVYDFNLIRRSARNLSVAALFSVATATLYFLISPVSNAHSELLARTQPTIYDCLIGFFGGAAGIVAIATKNKGNVIPGVAIATALMPPLCTAGYGLATWNLNYFFGAFYLFLINSIFIAFATLIGVKLFRFGQVNFPNEQRRRRVKRIIYTIVTLTILPAVYLTAMMLHTSFFTRDATRFVDEEINIPNTQIFSSNIYTKGWSKYIEVSLIGERVDTDSLETALAYRMDESGMLRGTHLSIKQGLAIEQSGALADTQQQSKEIIQNLAGHIDRQQATIDSLRAVVRANDMLDSMSREVAPEIRVLYPEVSSIAFGRVVACRPDGLRTDTINVALVTSSRLLRGRDRMRDYLQARTGLDSITIITR